MSSKPTGEIILYRQDDGTTEITVHLEGETVWLSQQQIAGLFGTIRENITMHLRNTSARANSMKRQPVRISYKFAMREADESTDMSCSITLMPFYPSATG